MPSMGRLPFGLCAWGLTYNLGLQGAGGPKANPKPRNADWMLDLASLNRFSHVELSSGVISKADRNEDLRRYRDRLDGKGMGLVLSGPGLFGPDARKSWKRCLEQARILGARHIRTTLSSVLCGERKDIGGLEGWKARMAEALEVLRWLGPQAEAAGLRLAIENHQDATSWDLMELCEGSGSAAVGVTLDCGNPLAVGESVLSFAERILPRLVHAHLKDYTLHKTSQGFLLARCAIGRGVVPYPALLRLFRQKPGMTWSLELSALEGRAIRVMDEDWWAGFPARDRAEAQEILSGAAEGGDPRTPWEKGLGSETARYEVEQVEESLRYLEPLWRERT